VIAAHELIVDSFAGGGGASLGIEMALGRGPDIAVNHDEEAIALHRANHPHAYHVPKSVWSREADPVTLCQGRPVAFAWFSPDCKHFSKAKGGKPVDKKIRGLAWAVIRWASQVRPRVIGLENVEEFEEWGPLYPPNHPNPKLRNRPNPADKGRTFKAFTGKLRRLGYEVQWRWLRACDYGAPTIRRRLFLIARCDGQPIVWPKPTHGKGLLPYRTAAECIDWSIACPSIFLTADEAKAYYQATGDRIVRPLAEATMRRIFRGLKRFVLDSPKPFIVPMQHENGPMGLEEPLHTVTTQGNKFNLVVPYIAGVGGRQGQSPERGIDQPFQTITAKADSVVATPYLVPTAHQGDERVHSLEEPLRTNTGHRGNEAMVAPMLLPRYGDWPGHPQRGQRADQPMPTIVPTENSTRLVTAFMAQNNTGETGHAMEEPVSTIVGKGCTQSLVEARLAGRVPAFEDWYADTKALGGSREEYDRLYEDSHQLSLPMASVSGQRNHAAEVCAFLVAYFGNERDGSDLFDPMRTVTAKERFGLVTVHGIEYVIADIGMRMLAPRELYRAQGFPDSYKIEIQYNGKPLSKTAQVRMVGNSVCPPLAAAIVAANFGVRRAEEKAA
jgi:DNA (cytosine-5)-methyltransferase 1